MEHVGKPLDKGAERLFLGDGAGAAAWYPFAVHGYRRYRREQDGL